MCVCLLRSYKEILLFHFQWLSNSNSLVSITLLCLPLPHSFLIKGICLKVDVQKSRDIQKLYNNSKHKALELQSHVNV